MRQWIAAIAAASVLSAMAMALTPKGRVRQVTGLACALVCALAVASPVTELDLGELAAGIAGYEQRARAVVSDAEEEAKMLDRTYIEERCQAYILGKAGPDTAAVTVTARWDEEQLVWYPWSAQVDGAYDAALAAVMEGELGIPPSRQSWRDHG